MKWLMIILTAIFTIAKLMHVITWSWWLVLLPVWIYIGLWFFILLVTLIVEAVVNDV